MKVLVSGGTGFVGRRLVGALAERGEEVTVLSRGSHTDGPRVQGARAVLRWDPDGDGLDWQSALEGQKAVVHLAGERAIGVRYTEQVKKRIMDSRVKGTQALLKALEHARVRPSLLLCASAVGYYGARVDRQRLDESAHGGEDFLARVCSAWEAQAVRAEQFGMRVIRARFGVVLGRGGGALAAMLLPFKLGLGGSMGTGEQGMSWIHLEDLVGIVLACLDDPRLSGPVNVTAPEPVSNAEFSRTLAQVLGRPAWLKVPAWALKLGLGEGAEPVLGGQWAIPAAMQKHGYHFRYPTLLPALQDLLKDSP